MRLDLPPASTKPAASDRATAVSVFPSLKIKWPSADAPVPYDASDPDDGPYDPNDDAAVDRFLTEANRVHSAPGSKDRKVAKAS
jgi:hypothetical protein